MSDVSSDGKSILNTCQWCGNSQKSKTVFTALLFDKFDDIPFEITICKDCFKEMFNNNYGKMIKTLIETNEK